MCTTVTELSLLKIIVCIFLLVLKFYTLLIQLSHLQFKKDNFNYSILGFIKVMEYFVIFLKVISSAAVNCNTVFSVDFLSVTEQLIIIITIAL